MIDIRKKYEAVFFGNISDIKPSAETIPTFVEMFRDKGFLPSTFHEIRPPVAVPMPRLRLLSPDDEWNIDFDSHRIVFQKKGTKPKGSNLGSPENFAKDVVDFCRRILDRFPKKGNRLSLLTEEFLFEMPEERLRRIYTQLFQPIKFYSENQPVEWNFRTVARIPVQINGNDEKLNTITCLDRVQGHLAMPDGIEPFDRIRVIFDINTFQDNVEARFGMKSVTDFYPTALNVREKLLSELEDHINGQCS